MFSVIFNADADVALKIRRPKWNIEENIHKERLSKSIVAFAAFWAGEETIAIVNL